MQEQPSSQKSTNYDGIDFGRSISQFFSSRLSWWNKEHSKTNTGAFDLPEEKVLPSIVISAGIVFALSYFLYRYYFVDREKDWIGRLLQFLKETFNNLKESRKKLKQQTHSTLKKSSKKTTTRK